jgi:hypothetical protein
MINKIAMDNEDGRTATLKESYNGYTHIELIEKVWHKWRVRICGSGKEIEVYEDEFELD